MTSKAPPPTEKTTSNFNVLLIDDDIQHFRLLSVLINTQATNKYELSWARNQSDALGHLQKGDIDIVAVDYNLGLEFGSDVISHLSRQYPNQAFLLVTGNQDPEVYRKGIDAGAIGFVQKGKNCGKIFDQAAQYALERKRLENGLAIANASKDWLMSLLAKDLGNPLFALNKMLAETAQEAENMPREMLVELIETAYQSSCAALKATAEMIEWGQSVRGPMQPTMEMVEVEECLQAAIRLFTANADEKAIYIAKNGKFDTHAYCDRHMLNTVARNLLGGLIQFCDEGKSILINGRVDRHALHISLKARRSEGQTSLSSLINEENPEKKVSRSQKEREAVSSITVGSHLLDAMGSNLHIEDGQGEEIVLAFKLPLSAPEYTFLEPPLNRRRTIATHLSEPEKIDLSPEQNGCRRTR